MNGIIKFSIIIVLIIILNNNLFNKIPNFSNDKIEERKYTAYNNNWKININRQSDWLNLYEYYSPKSSRWWESFFIKFIKKDLINNSDVLQKGDTIEIKKIKLRGQYWYIQIENDFSLRCLPRHTYDTNKSFFQQKILNLTWNSSWVINIKKINWIDEDFKFQYENLTNRNFERHYIIWAYPNFQWSLQDKHEIDENCVIKIINLSGQEIWLEKIFEWYNDIILSTIIDKNNTNICKKYFNGYDNLLEFYNNEKVCTLQLNEQNSLKYINIQTE